MATNLSRRTPPILETKTEQRKVFKIKREERKLRERQKTGCERLRDRKMVRERERDRRLVVRLTLGSELLPNRARDGIEAA